MKKIVVITEEGRGGGPLYRIPAIAQQLEGSISTTILYPKATDIFAYHPPSKKIFYKPISLHPLTRSPIGLMLYVCLFLPEVIQLYRFFKSARPDLVHCNGSWQFKGIIAARFAGVKVLWHMNDAHQPFIIRRLFRLLSKLPAAYIFASNRTKNYYASISPFVLQKKFRVIQAPVRNGFSANGRKAMMPGNGLKVLSAGYINANKGFHNIVEAARISRSLSCPEIQFYIAGKVLKSQRKYFRRLTKLKEKYALDNVHFLGHREDLPEIMASSDVFLCASSNEASPMSVWEALACGLPVISTDVGDVRNIVLSGRCGWILKNGQPDELASVVCNVATQTNDLKEFSRNARKTAKANFSLEGLSRQYLDFYHEIL